MTFRAEFFLPGRRVALLSTLVCVFSTSACSYFRTLGSGTHLNKPDEQAAPVDHRTRVMVVQVTTDGAGQIADIHFVRSSGREGIDGFVADTIRNNWPAEPSTKTVVQVTYSVEAGFSQPKVLSKGPAT